jgi:chromosome segregation ATPase
MLRASFLTLLVLVMPAAAFCQAPSSDSQTLHDLLTEVRELRQELQSSLARVQSAQILLTRLQIQQVAVTRASQHLDEARSKLAEVQVVLKSEAAEIKRFEDGLTVGENPEQQRNLQAEINGAKSDLEASTSLEQQRLATEIDAEQQLQTEQNKLNSLEAQLDELARKLDKTSEQPVGVPH